MPSLAAVMPQSVVEQRSLIGRGSATKLRPLGAGRTLAGVVRLDLQDEDGRGRDALVSSPLGGHGRSWCVLSGRRSMGERTPVGVIELTKLDLHLLVTRILVMEALPLAAVKAKLSALVDQVEDTHDRVVITRNGRPAAVLISPEELESLEETLAVMSDPAAMRRIRRAQQEIDRGEVVDEEQLAALMSKRAGRASG